MKYQPHIDGLRALAVVLVLFFHLEFAPFTGGFIGVDVFYVISGFLITSIIKNDIELGRFSLKRFYMRRARRLLPAVFFTVAVCFVVAGFLFTPFHFQSFANSAIAAVMAVSNIQFWYESDYFDIGARVKPLLHTWSLSVEWQFYLIWPSMLMLFFAVKKRWFPPVAIGLVGVISLWVTLAYQDGEVLLPGVGEWIKLTFSGPTTTFYHFPFRIFEFAIGASLIWLPRPNPAKGLSGLLLAVGIGMIVYSAVVFDEYTLFPSYNALVPAVGAALAILAGPAHYLGNVLRNPVSVYIGQISYSVYLVHWPLIVFSEYLFFRKMTIVELSVVGMASLTIGALMYRYIELPFHKGKALDRFPGWARPLLVAACALIIIVPARAVINSNGWIWRIDQESQTGAYDATAFHKEQYGGAGFEVNKIIKLGEAGNPSFMIIGDSHALHYAHGISQYLKRNSVSALGLFDHGCFIAPTVTRFLSTVEDKVCSDEYDKIHASLVGNNIPIIISYFWMGYQNIIGPKNGEPVKFETKKQYVEYLLSEISIIKADVGKNRKIIIIGQVPGAGPGGAVTDCVFRPNISKYFCASGFDYPEEKSRGYHVNKMIKEYAVKNDLIFLDPQSKLCRENICSSIIENKIMYSDPTHLSKNGSAFVMDKFSAELNKAIESTE